MFQRKVMYWTIKFFSKRKMKKFNAISMNFFLQFLCVQIIMHNGAFVLSIQLSFLEQFYVGSHFSCWKILQNVWESRVWEIIIEFSLRKSRKNYIKCRSHVLNYTILMSPLCLLWFKFFVRQGESESMELLLSLSSWEMSYQKMHLFLARFSTQKLFFVW